MTSLNLFESERCSWQVVLQDFYTRIYTHSKGGLSAQKRVASLRPSTQPQDRLS